MIDLIFEWCVQVLVWLANGLGVSYRAINVYIFVIIWPLITLALIVTVIIQARALRRANHRGNRFEQAHTTGRLS